ncbi:MAG: Rab family GTPase, partial [Candidatus Lokiarchaeia archaeon]|nr:Rab family GTPase [Candidatus Lokiarchaeia archaeon]
FILLFGIERFRISLYISIIKKSKYLSLSAKMSQYDYTFKIVILGDDSEGKTAFTKRYCYNIFNPSERLTIGVDFHVKTMRSLGKAMKLQLWDVGGEERLRFLLPTYCLGANAAIFMYDITKPSTLDHISEWMEIVRSKGGDIPIILIGSKLYSEESRAVSKQEGISVAKKNNLSAFGEICSETGQNVEQVFELLGKLLMEKMGVNIEEDIITRLPLTPLEFTPIRIKPEFKINEHLELRLEGGKTNIYVGGRLFNQCKYLLLNLTSYNSKNYSNIESMDEAAEKLDPSMEGRGSSKLGLSPEIEFWGHCSNLQAWYENNYDTRILHRNLAFPLLKALVEAGDSLAKKVFKEEISLRLESGYPSVVLFLINQGYLNYHYHSLTKEELDTILEKPTFIKNLPKWFFEDGIPKWLTLRIKAILNELECPYCHSKIPNKSIQKFLNGKSLICELCYTKIFKD